jgi:hypothetical protein
VWLRWRLGRRKSWQLSSVAIGLVGICTSEVLDPEPWHGKGTRLAPQWSSRTDDVSLHTPGVAALRSPGGHAAQQAALNGQVDDLQPVDAVGIADCVVHQLIKHL